MSALIDHVRTYARLHAMWQPATRVIAAVSGGADSVALLCLLHDLHSSGELSLDAVAHLNHAIRGREADDDEAFCAALAASLNVTFVAARVDVPARARAARQSIEVTARHARREFLDEVRRSRGADVTATAHTADDQAETILLRAMRGTGLRGLAGIAPVGNARVRPLLATSGAALRTELGRRGQAWREDATNADLTNPRNRVRHELIPYLERHFNPAARAALCRLAELARDDNDILERDAVAAATATLKVDGTTLGADAPALSALPTPIARRVVRLWLRSSTGRAYLPDIEAVRAVASGARRAADIPGGRVEHSGRLVVLIPGHAVSASFRVELQVPGRIEGPDAGWTLEAVGPIERAGGAGEAGGAGGGGRDGRRALDVEIDAGHLSGPLVVRSRRPGDRLRPVGLGGSKKLQDVLVDRKVPRSHRDRIPIVTDSRDRIIWVPGHVLDEGFRVTELTSTVVVLKLRRHGAWRSR